jgi:hypothetical protein
MGSAPGARTVRAPERRTAGVLSVLFYIWMEE